MVLLASVACKSRPPAPILTWHEVGADGQPASESEGGWRVSQSRFIAQLDAISGAGFHTVPLSALLAQVEGGPALPPKSVVLTFDDGTQDHLERVLPALRAHKMVAAFFVVASKVRADDAHHRRDPHQSRDVGVQQPGGLHAVEQERVPHA